MSDHMMNTLAQLEVLAQYDGPWDALRDARATLAPRVEELRERMGQQDDVLMVALVGGSGVGKSTLLNALAGDTLAKMSEYRPCTTHPTVYHPPGMALDAPDWHQVSGSALEHLIIVDTPDSDSIALEHRERVLAVLKQCDLILLCGSPEKYLDEATWSLLRPLQDERTLVCVETKAQGEASAIQEHWQQRMTEAGFEPVTYFRVNALRSLDRKLNGEAASAEEHAFEALENFLREELSAERIRRIKRANMGGLLSKSIQGLQDSVEASGAQFETLQERVDALNGDVCKDVIEIVERRLFTESHLWTFALGKEVGLRAKGLVGTLYRLVEGIRTLPARLSGWLPWRRAGLGTGKQAAALLTQAELFQDDLALANEEMARLYNARHSEVALAFTQAGVVPGDQEEGRAAFSSSINQQVSAFLKGPARDVVVVRARRLTSWPVTLLSDLAPIAFIVYAGYAIVQDWFAGVPLPQGHVTHTAMVLAILLGVELAVLLLFARVAAWSARRAALQSLKTALGASLRPFQHEAQVLESVQGDLARIQGLKAK